ncbi:MAG: hydrogenase maturation nickel metallochaperone HypA [Deltaproteobacteria bacterium]|nr:hydrogenase maturation nickel metallochaperone HypA [Deltaproteobacteria bacterium]
MHEMSITKSMLEIIKDEMDKSKVSQLRSVRIKVGELTAVEPDALRFCFEASTKNTPLEGASLEIEEVPLKGKCRRCGNKFRIEAFVSRCPECGGADIEKISGTELDIVSIEAE